MNVDLTTFLQIVGAVSWIPITAWGMYTTRKIWNRIEDLKEEGKDFFMAEKDAFIQFYTAEKTDIAQSLPTIIQGSFGPQIKSAMSILGQNSGISRQMKGLEQDLISDGIDSAIPGAGPLIAKYAQKYPILLSLAQQFGPQLMGKKNGDSGQGHSDGNNPFA